MILRVRLRPQQLIDALEWEGGRLLELDPRSKRVTTALGWTSTLGGGLQLVGRDPGSVQGYLDHLARLDVRNVDGTVGSVDALPFADGRFAGAVALGIVGRAPDPSHALAELARVLDAGGRLVVGEPALGRRLRPERLAELAQAVGLEPGMLVGRRSYLATFDKPADPQREEGLPRLPGFSGLW